MATTIQISHELKKELQELKKNSTYEDIIKKMLKKQKRMIITEQMKEYGTKYGDDSLRELKEWEHTDTEW